MTRSLSPARRWMSILAAAPFILAACTTAASDEPSQGPTAVPSAIQSATAPSPGSPAAASMPIEPSPSAAAVDPWLAVELTDAATGETFTLASFAGGVVAIEPMAVWCSNCKAQQDDVKRAYKRIADLGVTYISLGVDPGEDASTLARYADQRGYGWTFSRAPKALARELRDLFGPQILSPPSTPLIVLDASGEVVYQGFGFHSPDELLGILAEATA